MLTGMARVLLVDDDPAILRLLEVNFRLEGFTVDACGHGEEALALAAVTPPDVAILDLMIPGMDGRAIYDALRADPGTASVPVVFLTARGRDDVMAVEDAIVVQKPFDIEQLVATVRTLVETGSP
jgi:DNA-binding response OmpR family regulator